MKMGVNSFNDASVPYFMKLSKNNPNSKEIYSKIITVWAVLVAFAALGISLFSKEIIEIMTTPAFYDAYKVVPILVLAYVFRGLYCFPINGLFYAKKTKIIPIVTIVAAITNVALNLLWIPRYGIMGAAWATACAFGVTAILAYYFSCKYYPLIYEYGKLVKIFGSALMIFMITWYIVPESLLYSLLIKLLALLIFLVCVFSFKIVTIGQIKKGYAELRGA
jgi:O-antigen/teichoic acid export membrane protein